MTQWMLHRISSTASAGSGPPSSSLSLSLFSPPLPLLFSPPPLLSLLSPFSSPSDRLAQAHCSRGRTHTNRNSSSSSRRTGRCAEACLPPSCSTGKTLRSPLLSVKDYLFEKCVCMCACESRDLKSRQRGLPHPGSITTAKATQGECCHGYFHTHILFILYLFLSEYTRIYIMYLSAGADFCFSFTL